ncbi:acyltransferase Pun1 [Lactuca sativa]|nr:acyltransferase Pun1 [Lactuca sativa]
MTMIGNLRRFGRKQLHTIISKEIIKPSSPTPSHLKTFNLSVLDQALVNTFMPFVIFYPNTGIYPSSHDKTLPLKKSLSQTLTKYYPFAGRFAKLAPSFVDCNDQGAEFLEASIDSTLSDFLKRSQHGDLDQFFPHGLVNQRSNRPDDDDDLQSNGVIPLAVQVNHFECGGVAVAVSLSHKLADGSSFIHFLRDWAKTTQFCSREQKHELLPNDDDPKFIHFEYTNLNFNGLSLGSDECVTKSFMFPNAKINDFKLKVKAMSEESGQTITNPTRIEVLTWLLYKSAVAAATKNYSGSDFQLIGVGHQTNIRHRLMEQLPEKSIGNFHLAIDILSEMKPESFISEFKKQKLKLHGLPNIQTAFVYLFGITLEEAQRRFDGAYICSSLCGYSTYEIDFGWGNPVKATVAGDLRKNSFIMMDAPNRDGIEVLVCLGKQDLAVVQSDHELLAFCN